MDVSVQRYRASAHHGRRRASEWQGRGDARQEERLNQLANFVWGIADQLRGVYRPAHAPTSIRLMDHANAQAAPGTAAWARAVDQARDSLPCANPGLFA